MMFHKNSNSHLQLNAVFKVQCQGQALVTGGGSGIGLLYEDLSTLQSATQALAINGAKVYIVGRTMEKLDAVVRFGFGSGSESVLNLTAATLREKCFCILVNNAGTASSKTTPEGKDAAEFKKNLFDTTTFEEWTSLYTNVVAPFLIAFLPLLQRETEQHHDFADTIINITSISGLTRIREAKLTPGTLVTRAFVHLTKILATEIIMAVLSVRVNRQRPGNDRDIAAAILFAASCQYLNEQNIPVNGGFLGHVGQ
ncbi:hypothetical protein B0H19DRAFT_1209951 [Mycena capillaripes]|nr:hypothetical protein B0H19DRAFT_1209951 [Mycena capillaripes]